MKAAKAVTFEMAKREVWERIVHKLNILGANQTHVDTLIL